MGEMNQPTGTRRPPRPDGEQDSAGRSTGRRSPRRRSFEEMGRSEEGYRAISEVVSDWSYALRVEPDGRPVDEWTSLNIQRVSGFTVAELANRGSWLYLAHAEDRDIVRSHLDALLTGKTDVAEYRIVTKSGETRWLRDYASPLGAQQSGAMTVVGGVRDITARRQAELDRARLLTELEATNERLESLTCTVSHELREPLTDLDASLAGLEEVLDTGHRDRLRADMTRTREAASRILEMLEALQQISSITALQSDELVSLDEVARHVVELCGDSISASGTEVSIADLPAVAGDRLRLLQLLRILVENGIRYMGDQPYPKLEIGTRAGADAILLVVSDNGVGIAREELDRVFDVFHRVDEEGHGTGIGLALARRIAELHGGRIWAESDGAGRGAAFYVQLPK